MQARIFKINPQLQCLQWLGSGLQWIFWLPEWCAPPRRAYAHTCFELPLRILVVECILRAKTLPLHLTGMGRWRDSTKYQEATIAIASAVEVKLFWKDCWNKSQIATNVHDNWKRQGGSWVNHCLSRNWHNVQVRRWASPSISQATDECLCSCRSHECLRHPLQIYKKHRKGTLN